MATTTGAKQIALDNGFCWATIRKQVEIGKCNNEDIMPEMTPKELHQSIVPMIYMQQFWATIKKHESSYQFKIDKKRFSIDMEVFREILQICSRLPTQEFDDLPSKEEIISFIKDSGARPGGGAHCTGILSEGVNNLYKQVVDILLGRIGIIIGQSGYPTPIAIWTEVGIAVAFDLLRDALSAIFGLSELKAPPSPDYVPGPEHDDDEIVAEDQPYAEDASPIAQSPDYVPETDPEADPEEDGDEDPEEDPIDYPADGGDDGDDEMDIEEDEDDDRISEADEGDEETDDSE
ncbi:hypothetical protein Tco_0157997 [Tanacetum coccineum]